jgi:putative endonuclease
MTYKKIIGNRGEEFAADFLISKGYRIIEKNFYSRYGEIDLVTQDSGAIVFVEVKTRRNKSFGDPEDSVTPTKLKRIYKAGLMWLQAHPESPEDWRIEVLSILLDEKCQVQDIRHFVDI